MHPSGPCENFILIEGDCANCICMDGDDGDDGCGWELGLGDFFNTKKYSNATATKRATAPPAIHIFLDDVSGLAGIAE